MKVIIVDTEAEHIAAQLQKTDAGISIAGVYESGEAGIGAIYSELPDLAIVNIDVAGIGTLGDWGQHEQPLVEFVLLSEWSTFAYEAFRFGATDFLLKPVEERDWQHSLERVSKKVNDKMMIQNAYPIVSNLFPRLRDNRIAIPSHDAIDYVPVRHIVRCEHENTRCRVVLEDRRVLEYSGSFSDLTRQLYQYPFQRVNNDCVVNLCHVARYQRREDNLVLRDGATVHVSAPLRAEVLRRLGPG